MEKYVVKQVSKIILGEATIDRVLAEYNRYAAERTSNAALIEKCESQIKDVDKQIDNLVSAIASGYNNETLQVKLESLEAEKKKIAEIIVQEQKAVGYLPATKEELRQAYKKAQEHLLYGAFEEQKTVLNMFLNRVVIFGKFVEIYTNLIPLPLLGGIDLSISSQDFLAKISPNSLENGENTANCIEKDGIDSSFPNTTLHSDIFSGSPGRI